MTFQSNKHILKYQLVTIDETCGTYIFILTIFDYISNITL